MDKSVVAYFYGLPLPMQLDDSSCYCCCCCWW